MIKAIKILKELINSTVHTVTVNTIVDNGDNTFTLSTPFTYYLKINSPITIDSIDYKVVSFVMNESITVKPLKGTTPVTSTSFIIPPPTFLHGTPTAANNEYVRTKSNPFIWVLEFLEADYNNSTDSPVKGTFDFDIFFLTDVPQGDWLVTDHYENAIYPMNNEIDYFLNILNDRIDLFGDIDNYKVINHVNFGDYVVNKGYDKKIIEANLSGSQLKISIPYITEDCECGCPLIEPINTCVPAIVKNSDVSYIETIESGGVLVLPDITHTDTDLTPVTLPAQEPMICTPVVLERIYLRPIPTGQSVIYAQYDDAWKVANNADTYTPPTEGIPMVLDKTNGELTVPNNKHGHKYRRTGLTGGYYDHLTDDFKDINGIVTNYALAFPDDYIFDNHHGIALVAIDFSTEFFTDAFTFVNNLTHAGFTDYWIPNESEFSSVIRRGSGSLLLKPYDSLGSNRKLTSTTFYGATTSYIAMESNGFVSVRSKATFASRIVVMRYESV